MKKTLALLTVVLAASFLVAAAPPSAETGARSEELPPAVETPALDAVATVATTDFELTTVESELCAEADTAEDWTPAAAGRDVGCGVLGSCNRWDSKYCNYSCSTVFYSCCEAEVVIPGSYCPDICA